MIKLYDARQYATVRLWEMGGDGGKERGEGGGSVTNPNHHMSYVARFCV